MHLHGLPDVLCFGRIGKLWVLLLDQRHHLFDARVRAPRQSEGSGWINAASCWINLFGGVGRAASEWWLTHIFDTASVIVDIFVVGTTLLNLVGDLLKAAALAAVTLLRFCDSENGCRSTCTRGRYCFIV